MKNSNRWQIEFTLSERRASDSLARQGFDHTIDTLDALKGKDESGCKVTQVEIVGASIKGSVIVEADNYEDVARLAISTGITGMSTHNIYPLLQPEQARKIRADLSTTEPRAH